MSEKEKGKRKTNSGGMSEIENKRNENSKEEQKNKKEKHENKNVKKKQSIID